MSQHRLLLPSGTAVVHVSQGFDGNSAEELGACAI
jgi:hypothetical protein